MKYRSNEQMNEVIHSVTECALQAKLDNNFTLELKILPWVFQKAKFESPYIFWVGRLKITQKV